MALSQDDKRIVRATKRANEVGHQRSYDETRKSTKKDIRRFSRREQPKRQSQHLAF